MSEPVWFPGEIAATNVGRFMAAELCDDFTLLYEKSVEEPQWFWNEIVEWLDIRFRTPYDEVLNTGNGIAWATWFTGGQLNVVDTLLSAPAEQTALVWEGENGDAREWSYEQLTRAASGVAQALRAAGIGKGDTVGVFMPMLPETVAGLLGTMAIGAVFLPLFSGYGAGAVASRLQDAEAKALLTAHTANRRGKSLDMISIAEQALAQCPTVTSTLCVGRNWPEPTDEPLDAVAVDSEHPLFIAYTSGTTGRPKGTVATHAGFLTKVAEEVAFQFDVRADDRLFWFTDMGWIMGPWEVIGTLANRATLVLYEGAPDWPDVDRLWSFVERHKVTVLGISPTLIRSLMSHGDEPVRRHDLSSLRVLGSTGEPWNESPWLWYFHVIGGGRCPVINISGGTEVGACFLSPHPIQAIKPMSLGGPCLGMAVDVFDDNGEPLRGAVGELVCTKPWPGMTRGIYKDPQRYIDTYWSRWPDVWVHGDWASIDDEGDWFLHGRSDDTIKVAGKRLGPAEVESLLVSHAAVVEAAAVGIPDDLKGEALWCFVVLAAQAEPSEALRRELKQYVAEALGKSFAPSAVRFTTALPKTRNAKVLRRAVRGAVTGEDVGDLSSLEDPATIEAVKAAL
ncbi:MAG TPA: AMP-binding protein [Acidimicrobiales bacterium]|nr:AMP-binding protein [Acidimicrobiales bacterium]